MVFIWVFGTSEISWCLARHFASSHANFTTDELKVLTPHPNAVNNAHWLHDTATQTTFSAARQPYVGRLCATSNDGISGFSTLELEETDDTNITYQNVLLHLGAVGEDIFPTEKNAPEDTTEINLHVRLRAMPPIQCVPKVRHPEVRIPKIPNKLLYDPEPLDQKRREVLANVLTAAKHLGI